MSVLKFFPQPPASNIHRRLPTQKPQGQPTGWPFCFYSLSGCLYGFCSSMRASFTAP